MQIATHRGEFPTGEVARARVGTHQGEFGTTLSSLKGFKMPSLKCNDHDKTKWKDRNGNLTNFHSKVVWEAIYPHGNVVNWSKVVWFSKCNPRMVFIMWMALRNRLQTQGRIMVWSNDQNLKCPLCKKVNDSHNHLFFECDYAISIWTHLKMKIDKGSFSNRWDELVDQYSKSPCNNSIGSILRRIVLSTTVYHIWKERNARIFTNERMDDKTTLKFIIDNIKLQHTGMKVKNSTNVQKIAAYWNISMNSK
ncbi:reverse transcriptase zinc-binding domain-containing protein [Tanacetum coccineum]